jgi:hypothetical protein
MNVDMKRIFAAAATVLLLSTAAQAKKELDLPDTASTDRTVPSVQVNSIDADAVKELNKKNLKAQRKAERRHLLNVKLGFFGFHIM